MKHEAKFTKFDATSQWVEGLVGEIKFAAKIYDEPSIFGINKGRVSKLSLRSKDGILVNYDRGWDKRPHEEIKPYYKAVMKLLKESPKRFTEQN
jgi:hypothetical protein